METAANRLCEIARHLGQLRYADYQSEDIVELIEEARLLLGAGLNPNTPDTVGHTALGLFASNFRGNERDVLVFAELLLSHGANPMLGDRPLGTLISHNSSSFLVTGTLSAIARSERAGNGLRDAAGGNVLHYLAVVDPQLAAWQLEEDVCAIADFDPDPAALFFPPQMINARRSSDGSTPLDVLWRTGAKPWMDGKVEHAWQMTKALMALGADPLLADAKGVCVLQDLDRMIQAGTIQPREDVWAPLAAKWSHRDLATDTVVADPAAASSSRPSSPRF